MTEQRSPEEFTTEKLPKRLPILPLHETALYPKMVLPLVVMQGDSIKLVDEAMQKIIAKIPMHEPQARETSIQLTAQVAKEEKCFSCET